MRFITLYNILLKKYGKQGWWPAETRLEVIVGAILTQNTAWRNVEKSINNLKKEKMIDLKKLAEAPEKRIAFLIKPAGFFNQKAKRLKKICKYLEENYVDLNAFFKKPTKTLRKELLALKGIGPETADSILLYAGNHLIFVVDAYTKRILERLGITEQENYEKIQEMFHEQLPRRLEVFKEFHALFVEHAKKYCKKKPLCSECFLNKECEYFKGNI